MMQYALILAALAATLFSPAPAPALPLQMKPAQVAAAQAKASVVVLYAYNGKKGIDSRLPDAVKNKLKEPPFSAYDSYERVEQTDLEFALDKNAEHTLPNKDLLKLKLNSFDKKKYNVRVSIERTKDNKTTEIVCIDAKMKKDELFFVAGPKYKNGILVLGLRVGPK